MKTIRCELWLAVIATVALAGCHMRPNLGPPGTIGTQRNRAVLHDPFPSETLGPKIVGGRPRGFDLPLPEATDMQGSPFATRGSRRSQYNGF